MRLPFPKESGLELKAFNPTAITVAKNGDIYLATATPATTSSSSTRPGNTRSTSA